jgi:hypothetical protein
VRIDEASPKGKIAWFLANPRERLAKYNFFVLDKPGDFS